MDRWKRPERFGMKQPWAWREARRWNARRRGRELNDGRWGPGLRPGGEGVRGDGKASPCLAPAKGEAGPHKRPRHGAEGSPEVRERSPAPAEGFPAPDAGSQHLIFNAVGM
jgi:hypothetical protein